MSWYVLDYNSSCPSYWKLLETTIPCAALLFIVVNLSSHACTDDEIICKSNYNMHFISCDLQQCKYSNKMECIWLPLLAMICHALVVCSTYDTLQTWSDKSSVVSALLAYSAIAGFAGVVLFDSQGPNSYQRQWHFLCVRALTLSVWLLHAKCLLQLSKVITSTDRPLQTDTVKFLQRPDQLSMQTRRNYTLVCYQVQQAQLKKCVVLGVARCFVSLRCERWPVFRKQKLFNFRVDYSLYWSRAVCGKELSSSPHESCGRDLGADCLQGWFSQRFWETPRKHWKHPETLETHRNTQFLHQNWVRLFPLGHSRTGAGCFPKA